jgi:zinc transport system substrate-binding protein
MSLWSLAVFWAITFTMFAPTLCAAQSVFVSIPPQAFLVDRLAGDLVQIEVLLPPAASPATYEPTPKQMAALGRSQLYLQIGAPFEKAVLEKVADLMPDLPIVDCREGVRLESIESGDHHHGGGPLDPHIWLDPHRMKVIAGTTAKALKKLLPAQEPGIEKRLAGLTRDIDESDRCIKEILAPYAGRTFLVFHPAYGYFARRYNLVQKPVEVEGKSPSARRLVAIVGELQSQEIRALFVQPQFSRSSAERIAEALDCDLVVLDPLAQDYLENLEYMATAIAEALQ